MATILTLKPVAQRTHADTPTKSAEIILFPGVRYERWDSKPEASAPTAKKKRRSRVKRDRMVIGE